MEQIIIDNGYVVQSFFTLPPDNHDKWHSIRNFGDRQSDAIEFKNDIMNIDECRLRALAKMYNPKVRYIRIDSRNFKKQK